MNARTIGSLVDWIRRVEADVVTMRKTVDGEPLAVSDRQYLSRCFDLIDMELSVLREYISALRNDHRD